MLQHLWMNLVSVSWFCHIHQKVSVLGAIGKSNICCQPIYSPKGECALDKLKNLTLTAQLVQSFKILHFSNLALMLLVVFAYGSSVHIFNIYVF